MLTTVYILRDPRDGSTQYVGVTNGDLIHRCAQHVSARADGTRRGNWTAELFALGLRPIIECVERVPNADRDAAEKRWIASLKAEGIALLNATRGGKGFTGPMSDSAKAKLRAAKLGKPLVFGDGALRARRISERLKGIKRSAETRARVAAAFRGRSSMPPETRAIAVQMRDDGNSVRQIAFALGFTWDITNRAINNRDLVSGTGRELTLEELR